MTLSARPRQARGCRGAFRHTTKRAPRLAAKDQRCLGSSWGMERVKRFDLNFSCNFFEQYQCLRTPGNFRCWTFCWTFHCTLLCRSTWLVCHSRPVFGSMEIREVLVATPVSATLRFHPTRWHLRRAGTGRASKASRCLRHHLNLASVCTHFSCDEDVID